ncbi:tRNA (adenosine(37)-N6)-threonylcarbamoyltransferase complex dimerization subunit type 1 TsaB [Neptuniibacter halophilus]|uniref:tRNA (adenosine(37)-N6)-threonylcarbamoyltransferase complex dimerization subunit type 1 TsaB n=1 Tax=Neptuniibacter halophilus TaxID=651666 RepID=UPI00257434DC|nr:tRNA (adenosine(37)-N6)-threonylcarbamoyltransferase complex dimerization subunit type 1 TsaB [Neptuniibacter halophilus]
MAKILAFDTSTDACSVAVSLDGEVQEDFRVIPRQHTQQLLPMVESILANAGLAVNQLDAIAFGRGPGSFAGIRIATGAAQGLAYAADLPLLPVSTLEAMALAAVEQTGAEQVVAALDARMDEIYVASYRCKDGLLVPELAEMVCAPGDLELSGQGYLAVGSGWVYLNDMSEAVRSVVTPAEEACYPAAGQMLKLALRDWEKGLAVAADKALPVYLRDEVAWKKKDQQ